MIPLWSPINSYVLMCSKLKRGIKLYIIKPTNYRKLGSSNVGTHSFFIFLYFQFGPQDPPPPPPPPNIPLLLTDRLLWLDFIALIHFPSTKRELLMLPASFILIPVAPVFLDRSAPAKSTMENLGQVQNTQSPINLHLTWGTNYTF